MRLTGHSVGRFFLVTAFIATAAGCTDFSTTPITLGRVTVTVLDQNNAPAPGLVVDLVMQDRITIWRSLRTGSDGKGEFGKPDGGVKSQTYVVRLIEDATYTLDPTEANDKPLVVGIGGNHEVPFKVVKRTGPAPPPGG